MKTELKNQNYLTIEEVAKVFGVSLGEASKRLTAMNMPYKEIKKEGGGRAKRLYDIELVKQSFQEQQQQETLAKIANKADILSLKTDMPVLATAFANKCDELETFDDLLKLNQQMTQILMQKAHEKAQQQLQEKQKLLEKIEQKNKELQFYKDEKQYIDKKRHERATLIAKINKLIRTRAYQNHWTYKDTYIRYYKLYDEEHNFPYKENYTNYIKVIAERGDLLELYNLIVTY